MSALTPANLNAYSQAVRVQFTGKHTSKKDCCDSGGRLVRSLGQIATIHPINSVCHAIRLYILMCRATMSGNFWKFLI